MSLEITGQGEFAEFMAHHVLRYVDGDEGLAVVNIESVTDKIWCYGRATGPSLDWFTSARLCRLLDFFE